MRLLTFLLIAFLVLPHDAQAKRFLNIEKVKSPGGIEAWLVEDHTAPVIAIHIAFSGAGAATDPDNKQGIAQLASNTMDEGAGTLDSETFQKTLADLSISLDYSAARDDYFGSLKTLTRQKDKAFDLLRLSLTAPRFDAEPLQRMKDANLSRIRSSLSDPDWMAARLMNDLSFAGHPYAHNSGGTLTSIQAITADDLHAYVKDNLTLDRLQIGVSGDITKDELEKVLDTVFGTLPKMAKPHSVPDLTLQNENILALYKRDIPQTIILMTQPSVRHSDPDWQALHVMNYILGSSGFGSRLMEEIREKRGLTYGIYTSANQYDHIATLGLETSTRNEKTAEVLDLIKKEWIRMRDTDVNAQELKDAKDYLTGTMPLALTSSDAIAGMLIAMQLDHQPYDYLDTLADKINAVTTADVRRVSKRLLDPDKIVTVMVGNPVGVKPTKIIEKLPNAE